MARLRVDTDKFKVYLAKEFEMSFSRPFDDLPEYVKEHWKEVAEEMAHELLTEDIIEIMGNDLLELIITKEVNDEFGLLTSESRRKTFIERLMKKIVS